MAHYFIGYVLTKEGKRPLLHGINKHFIFQENINIFFNVGNQRFGKSDWERKIEYNWNGGSYANQGDGVITWILFPDTLKKRLGRIIINEEQIN